MATELAKSFHMRRMRLCLMIHDALGLKASMETTGFDMF